MFSLLGWLIYGLVVGVLAKLVFSFIYPDSKLNDTIGGFYVILLGAAGSYVGGGIDVILHGVVFSPSGLFMGVVGATIALVGLQFALTKGWLDRWLTK